MIIGISGKIGAGKDLIGTIINWLIWKDNYYPNDDSVKFFPTWYSKASDNGRFEIKKFADKIKDMVCLLIGCTREQLEDQKFKQTPLGEEWWYYKSGDTVYPYGHFIGYDKEMADRRFLVKTSPRLILQQLGTECGRQIIHPEIWVNALFADYKDTAIRENGSILTKRPIYPNWIITDVRFPNEADVIRKKGGIVIRVDRFYCPQCGNTENFEGGRDLCNECGNFLSKSHPSETGLDDYKDFNYHIMNDGTIEDLISKVKQILEMEGIIKGGFPVQS